jgi:hypothetical protein
MGIHETTNFETEKLRNVEGGQIMRGRAPPRALLWDK